MSDALTIMKNYQGLFLIGLVLCYAFERTGNLYLAIGLHAGWIFGLKTIRVFGDYSRQNLGWLFGSINPKIVSGIATWLGVVLVGIIIHRLIATRASMASDRLPASNVIPGME